MNTPTALCTWLDQAWNEHADATERVAGELAERAATLPDDADGAGVLRLAAHTLLAHQADTAAMQRLLAQVPPGETLAAAARPARWALAELDGGAEPPPVSDRERWAALEYVALVLVARGQAAQAQLRLLAEEDAAAAHPDEATRRAYAASANNVAGSLREGPRGDAGRDALMLAAAQLARRAWQRAGTWLQVERADYFLALCHVALGQGAEATVSAQACLARCEAEGADAYELFFAHECCMQAQHAAGNGVLAAQHRTQMATLLARIDDDGNRRYAAGVLAKAAP